MIFSGPKRFANLKAWVASLVQQFAIGADKELFSIDLNILNSLLMLESY